MSRDREGSRCSAGCSTRRRCSGHRRLALVRQDAASPGRRGQDPRGAHQGDRGARRSTATPLGPRRLRQVPAPPPAARAAPQPGRPAGRRPRRPPPESRNSSPSCSAFETVAKALEPNWDQRFADRLMGPDGLELVVELAHDLRSPLTSILFLGETMKRGRSGPVTPLQERQLGLIYSAAFGLSSVASDVIELARGRRPAGGPRAASVLGGRHHRIGAGHRAADRRGERARGPAGCPATRSSRLGHPVALSRILLNLTTNALKFTDEGYVEVTCTEPADRRWSSRCGTPGGGFRPRRWRCCSSRSAAGRRTATTPFPGSGLGLSICRKLVEAMNGSSRSRPGPGRAPGSTSRWTCPWPASA